MAKANKPKIDVIPGDEILDKIRFVRGQKVMLDFDLAALYEVETKVFNQAVKRNLDRFPEDFMFRLTVKEWITMRSQIVTASSKKVNNEPVSNMWSQFVTTSKENAMPSGTLNASLKKRNTEVTPYAFTEHGVAMLASVLKSERAVKMSVAIVRAFIELKKTASQFKELAEQLDAIKQHLGEHDAQLNGIYTAIENLLDDKVEKQTWENRKRIGFK